MEQVGVIGMQLHATSLSSSGAQYWVYDGEKPVQGPSPLSDLGLPESSIHAALVWGTEKNKIYFFRGGDYWRFHLNTRRVDSPVPRRVTDWRGVPAEIDAAFQDANGAWGPVTTVPSALPISSSYHATTHATDKIEGQRGLWATVVK